MSESSEKPLRPSKRLTDRPPGLTISGPVLVVATLSLFLVVPVVSIGIFWIADRVTDAEQATSPLIWDQRDSWPHNQFTVFKSLERGQMSSARTNKVHQEKLGLQVSAETYLAIQRCAELARLTESDFKDSAVRDQLRKEVTALPDLFYGHYLLGLWHRLEGDDASAEACFTQAFASAPAALIQRHLDTEGHAAAHRPVADIQLVVDRIVDDRRDPTLELIYPFLQTDREGFVYMPVFKAILRHRKPTPLPGLPDAHEKPQWFSFFGQVGRLPDETVR